MLDFIEKYRFAIIGTVVFHVGVFVYANFITVKRPFKLVEPQVEMNIPIDDIPFDEEMMKLLEIKAKATESQEVYNVTSDANDSRDKSFENFSTQEMDQKVLDNAKSLEQQYFDEWAGTHGDKKESSNSSMDIDQKDKNKQQNNQNNPDKSIDTQGDKSFAGDVLASFDLKDRKAHALSKPGYTCNTSGTVTLQIKVDRNGDVKDVTYLAEGSYNASECMIQQSIKYAKRARFNLSNTAPSLQTGTITYKFVSK